MTNEEKSMLRDLSKGRDAFGKQVATDDSAAIAKGLAKVKAADDYNRLRLGDAAEELYAICFMLERLPASELQTEISLKASDLARRMTEQAKSQNKD